MAVYNGNYNYNDLKTFFDSLVSRPAEDPSSGAPEKEVKEVRSPKAFHNHCEVEPCYLLLVDGSPKNKEALEGSIRTLKSINKAAAANIGWIDAVCHSEILGTLDIQQEDLPALFYIKSKGTRYARLIGRVSEESLKIFVAKVGAGRINERPIDEWPLQQKDCEEVHARLDALTNQESTLTAE